VDESLTGQVQVINLQGQEVATRVIHTSGFFRETLQLDHLSPGNYLLILRGGAGKILDRKMVVLGD